jgi:hypothetical protein
MFEVSGQSNLFTVRRTLMKRPLIVAAITAMCMADFLVSSAQATPFFFSTGNPDGLIATASRPSGPALLQIETADDFVLTQTTRIDSATFTGLLPSGAPLSNVTQVEIELYHVFPRDSVNPPSGNVLARANSPSDVEIGTATRDSAGGSLGFGTSLLNPSFSVTNTVVNGINKSPGQFTGGEGAAIGEEVLFNITFNTPLLLGADHYFFRPEVALANGNFLWLSAPKPIVAPGTAFPAGFTDLQSWIRNDDLAPDWSRIGTDITHQGPFNAAFSLTGQLVPEPSSLLILGIGLAALAISRVARLGRGRPGRP